MDGKRGDMIGHAMFKGGRQGDLIGHTVFMVGRQGNVISRRTLLYETNYFHHI